ncbi:MAG: pentapeptide repeat-containing protein [Nitrospiraceae bacterium]
MEHSTTAESFRRHLGKECSEEDRRSHAVMAHELLEALKNGQSLDLLGVVIEGDLLLDQLPPMNLHEPPPAKIQEVLRGRPLTDLREIPGSIAIRDSVMRGAISTRLKAGFMLAKGPVTMTGTTFQSPVDFSRTAFFGPVDFSNAIFLREGFFIQAIFDQPARFERTDFGTHTRFHRAVFGEHATFSRAGFNGLAELLEVSFEKGTSFSRAYFKMGTGFSGSRFSGDLDFSEALFEREVYFLFSIFEKDASFRRSTFRSQADFSDAQFKGVGDFANVSFKVDPNFTRTRMNGNPPRRDGLQDPRLLYGIGATVAVCMLLFVLVRRTR